MSKRFTLTCLENFNPVSAFFSRSKNLLLTILRPAPLSTSASTTQFPIFILILGDLNFVSTLLKYCRGLGQVPPSGPTGSPVVSSFPQTQDWVRKRVALRLPLVVEVVLGS